MTSPSSARSSTSCVLIVAALGVKLSARFNWGWAIFEYALMIGFAIAALWMIYVTGLSGAVHTCQLAVHAAQGPA